MIKYFIYARKSSEGEDKQITSIPDQIEECLKLAQTYNLEVVDIIEESKSAKEPGRKKFNEMMERIHKGEANGVIIWQLNRIARNPVDGGTFIWAVQKKQIRHVQAFGESYRSEDDLVMMYIKFGMSTQYSRDLSNNVNRGLIKKAMRGWCPYTVIPLGYKHHHDGKLTVGGKEIIPDKNFKHIKHLWKLFLTEKYSVSELKTIGDNLGITMRRRKRVSKAPSINTYYRIFKSEFYRGYFTWKDEDGNPKRYKGKHTAMITLKEFQKVQTILNKGISSPTVHTKNAFTGIFTCGECHSPITIEIVNRAYCKHCRYRFSIKNKSACPKCKTSIEKKEKFTFLHKRYYRCTKKRGVCKQSYIGEPELDTQILKQCSRLTIDSRIYKWCLEQLQKSESNGNMGQIKRTLKKNLNLVTQKLKGYADMRALNDITSQEYNSYAEPFKKQAETLKDEIDNLESTFTYWKQEREQELNLAHNLVESYQKGDRMQKKQIVQKIGSNTTIKDKRAYFITPKWLLPFVELGTTHNDKKDPLEHKKSLVLQDDLWNIDLPLSFGGANDIPPEH